MEFEERCWDILEKAGLKQGKSSFRFSKLICAYCGRIKAHEDDSCCRYCWDANEREKNKALEL